MDLTNVITMDPDEAQARAAAYREIKVPNDEDRRIVAIFTALAAGKQVIDLPQAVRDAGVDDEGLPVLAAGRVADAWCYLKTDRWASTVIFSNRQRYGTVKNDYVISDFRLGENVSVGTWSNRRSQVPMLPPEHRRWGRGQWTILWEVEEWAQAPQPPGDPILLRPLLGDLYTVEAHWDLTDVERLVLGQRP